LKKDSNIDNSMVSYKEDMNVKKND